MLLALHKPYGFLSRFTPEGGSRWRTLADLGLPEAVYPIGRLDAESEGLLLLSSDPRWNARLLHPNRGHVREYWAQVEGIPEGAAMERLRAGMTLGDFRTLPCGAAVLDPQPDVPPRDPPIRVRKSVPERWISLELIEGKYHQVRRMTAAVGHPTLRLIRVRIGKLRLFQGPLAEPGHWMELNSRLTDRVLGKG